MASPNFPEPPQAVAPTPIAEVDRILEALDAKSQAWIDTSIARRIELLEACAAATVAAGPAWVDAGCRAKGLQPDDERCGEEWLAGPMVLARNIRLLIDALEAGGQPKLPGLRTLESGQQVAKVMPKNIFEKLMFTGFSAEVYIEPGKDASQGQLYRDKSAGKRPAGGVALVLGAGNVASIGPMDVLYKLFVDDEVVICKSNPVNAYLGEHWEASLQPLVDEGVFRVVHGGADVGQHLTYHPKVVSVHITGSDRTHDAIVWGADPEESARRKSENDPKLQVPISSELGAVTPVLVVPGQWTQAELEFQARHVCGMVANNGSFNCNAAKALVVASGWAQKDEFIGLVRKYLAETPARKAYYPGAQQRYQGFLDNYPQALPLGERTDEIVPWTVIPNVPAVKGEYALTNEAFCGVLAEVELDARDATEFIDNMVTFGNDVAWGTLSCMILIDPRTEKAHKAQFERAVEGLRYGGIGINVWAGVIYGTVAPTWGAHPGHTLHDIQSGRGFVHNTMLIDHPQKSVLRAPFKIAPKPAWFANHNNVRQLGQRMTKFEAFPSFGKLPAVILAAIKG